jgi:CcmD family protein
MSFLVIAYAFAVLVLGGYLAWSLRRLRELEKRRLSER